MNEIKIYKASAGSGKTEALSREYIKMLLQTGLSDKEKFSRVLAVTFTNKATAEMKARIVEILYKISKGGKTEQVAGADITPQRAGKLLKAILHNYSHFRVSTIDKFFQQIIRAFVQELGLSSNYMVELDEDQVIEDTVTDILLNIGDKNNETFFKWFLHSLTDDASENGDDVKLRKLKKDLASFAKQIFNSKYINIKHLLPDAETYRTEIPRLKKRQREILDIFKEHARFFTEKMSTETFTESNCRVGSFTPVRNCADGKSFPVLNATLPKWIDAAQYANKTPKNIADAIESAYDRWLKAFATQFVNDVQAYTEEFNTNALIIKYAPYIGLFDELEKQIRRHTQSENTQLLSSSNEFIDRIIDGSDTPFIYEKTGTFIDNFLIDEFQDTSRLQWNNFKPLIENSVAGDNNNLIVGDVKQSIYRFRDSDWSILDSGISESFKGNTFSEVLDKNFRSLGNIITFNNDLFTKLANSLQNAFNEASGRADDTITKAYSDVVQKLPKQNSLGYVNLQYVAHEKGEYNNTVFPRVLEDIHCLQSHGYSLSDIGIIYRWKKGAVAIAQYLIENGINVISEEALLISSNRAVTDITAVLSYILCRTNSAGSFIVGNLLPKEIEERAEELAKLPMYELIEQIIYICGMDRDASNIPYLNAFKDVVSDYITTKGSNLKEFIEYWNEVKGNKSLTTSSTADAVNIITLHKSKGLAYKAVIMPEVGWNFKINNTAKDILWEKIPDDATEYSLFKCVPVEYCDKMRHSIFKQSYYDELLMQYIDNLNLLYVAFTRARNVLIGYCDKPKGNSKDTVSSISTMLGAVIDEDVCIGEIPDEKSKQIEDNGSEATQYEVLMSPEEKMNRFPLRDQDNLDGQREYGSRMHRVMEKVITIDDIKKPLEEMLMKGHIDQMTYNKMFNELTGYVQQAPEWFDGKQRVISERTVINVFKNKEGKIEKREKRPDRVLIDPSTGNVTIIDYKFGENREQKHISQVQSYMKLYKKAGHKNVTGYIYYLEGFNKVKVTD